MINSTSVGKVDLELFGEEHIRGLNLSYPKGNFPGKSIPFGFKFNCDWRIRFKCLGGVHTVSFAETGESPKELPLRLKPLTTAYYSKGLLSLLANAVPGVELVWNDDLEESLLTEASFTEKNGSILNIPIVSLMYVQCEVCGAEYVCWYRYGAGLEPERNLKEGKLSEMKIERLVHVGKNTDLMQLIKMGRAN